MKLEQTHIDKIRKDFAEMQSREDLLYLLNYAKPLVYGDKSVAFKMKQLTWYSNPKLGGKRYTEFKVKKKSGADRVINAPVKGLKALQKTMGFILQCIFEPHHAATGFVRNKSIVDNAKLHTGSKYIYNIDLKDFFPSIDQARVWKCLQLKPFNLVEPKVKQDFKINEKAYIIPVSIPNNSGSIKSILSKLRFSGYRLSNGYWSLQLKDGGHILYQIEKSANQDFEGSITVFKEKSSFENIKEIANNSAKNKEVGPDFVLDVIIGQLIELHQRRHFEKSSRINLANLIASLCCTEMEVERKNETGDWVIVKRNVLPQGAPTSPVITNIVCQRLDFILTGVAKRFGLKYSRYADDITFSSMHNVYQVDSDFTKELHRIITEQGFHIKESKTRLQTERYRQEVTGLLVNENTNVQKRYIKQIRMWLYYWERYDYEKAYRFFLPQYLNTKTNGIKGKPDMKNVIGGKLDYLKMVKGGENDLYLKLKTRFDILSGNAELKNKNTLEPSISTSSQTSLIDAIIENKDQPNKVRSIRKSIFATKQTQSRYAFPIIHNPKGLVNLLKKFSANSSPLKYTTHSWDSGRDAEMFRDLSGFLEMAQEQYRAFSNQLTELRKELNGKIYNFIFNKDISKVGWGDPDPKKRIFFGWSSPELLDACNQDYSLNPEDFILPIQYQFQRSGRTIQKFKQVIDIFKNEIEIRDENSALLNLILEKHDKHLFDFANPIINNLDNKTFYTDVQWLSKALDLIFENIKSRSQHRQVAYTLLDTKDDAYVLEILHLGSFNKGMKINDEKLRLEKGNFGDIGRYLKNLCDWSVESQFSEGFYRINYLSSEPDKVPHQKIDSADGFKHILTFYK